MASDMGLMVHFIDSAQPGAAMSPESRRRARSHAFRVAHARTKGFRIVEYQADKTRQQLKDGIAAAEMIQKVRFLAKPWWPNPVGLLSSYK
jgi:ribosomal protein L34